MVILENPTVRISGTLFTKLSCSCLSVSDVFESVLCTVRCIPCTQHGVEDIRNEGQSIEKLNGKFEWNNVKYVSHLWSPTWRWDRKSRDSANVHEFPWFSLILSFVQTSGSGVGQTNVNVWVAPHELHCHSVYAGRFFGCNCLLEVQQRDAANISIFKLHDLLPSFMQTSGIGQAIIQMYQVTVCVVPVLYCAQKITRTHSKVHTCWWVASKGAWSKNWFVVYWLFIILVHIVVYCKTLRLMDSS